MPTIQKSLRISEKVLEAINEIAAERDADFSSVANDLLDQATRMHRCPGIVFAHGPTGPRARVEGTGIDVWEVVATYKSLTGSYGRLRRAYPQLSDAQLRAALNYYRHFKGEIDRRVARNAAWTPRRLAARHPFTTEDVR